MPSFDVVNEVDLQEVDNAVNNTRKLLETRYDFRGSKSEITLNKKEKSIHILTEDEMKLRAIEETLAGNLIKRKLSPKVLEYKGIEATSNGMVKRDARLVEGIEMDMARKIVKLVKETGLKVQAQIQDEQVRVTAKKIDDLQAVIAMLREKKLDVPLQFVNMKS